MQLYTCNDVMTISRTSPSASNIILTYIGIEEGGLVFDVRVNDGIAFKSISFVTAGERDDYVASQ